VRPGGLSGLPDFVAGEILGIDQADGVIERVDDDDVIHAPGFEQAQEVHGESGGGDGDGLGGHGIFHGMLTDEWVTFVGAQEVPVGEDADQCAGGIADQGGTAAVMVHGMHGVGDGGGGEDAGDLIEGTHEISDAEQQAFAEMPARMITGELIRGEAALFEQGHGQGIAEGEHDRGAGGGSEIERAGFLFDGGVEDVGGEFCKGGVEATGKSDDGGTFAADGGENLKEFIGLPALAEGEQAIALADNAEIAMECVERVQHDGRGTGAAEGGGNFFADMPRFTDAEDDDFAIVFDGFAEELDSGGKGIGETGGGAGECLLFDCKDAPGAVKRWQGGVNGCMHGSDIGSGEENRGKIERESGVWLYF